MYKTYWKVSLIQTHFQHPEVYLQKVCFPEKNTKNTGRQKLHRLVLGTHSISDAKFSSKQENCRKQVESLTGTTKTKRPQNSFCRFLRLQIPDSSLSSVIGDTDSYTHSERK